MLGCLSPIGLSMVTKLAPSRLVGLAMGGNLSGLLADSGVLLLLISPLINMLMHGVR
ncbi:hypothetical protein GCM10008098_01050 [Rhodanobacter panaciterrae]|uniref:Uncharacterized protein n=1 Tax=Rhodanobacter panaciterrae TaxID=490572 RepID=A0ABQ2ZEC6_9GAMM|nr:hypothetical protein GCM10008098_01050 [Rhodanobacter panaciterrae]